MVLVDEVIASRIIKSTPASDKILNCFKKPGFKNFGSILSQLPYVETEPATHTLELQLSITFLAIFTLALFHSSIWFS